MWRLVQLISLAQGLFFILEPLNERCVGLRMETGRNFTCDYVVSGLGEYNVMTRVMTPSGSVLYQSPVRTRQGHYTAISAETGLFRLCFRGMDRKSKAISMSFAQQIRTLGEELGENLKEFAVIADDMQAHLDTVLLNIRFTREQELTHCALAASTSTLVLWTAFTKLVVLFLVAVLQIYLLTHTLDVLSHKSPI